MSGKVYGSADGGDSWKVVLDKPGLTWLAGDPTTPSRFYVSGTEGVYATSDGRDFTLIGGPKLPGRVTVDGLGRVYVASFKSSPSKEAGLWRYDAATQKWTRLREDNMIDGVAVDPTDPNRVAIITSDAPFHDEIRSSGVWLSDDAGQTWHQQNRGLSVLRGSVIAFDPHDTTRLVMGTDGRGFWTTRWPKTPFAKVPVVAEIQFSNGDMEAGAPIPTGWRKDWVGKGEITVGRETQTVHGGAAALRVEATDARALAKNFVEVKNVEALTVSGWLKTAGQIKCSFGATPLDKAGKKFGG